jgi:hypothetical protein
MKFHPMTVNGEGYVEVDRICPSRKLTLLFAGIIPLFGYILEALHIFC